MLTKFVGNYHVSRTFFFAFIVVVLHLVALNGYTSFKSGPCWWEPFTGGPWPAPVSVGELQAPKQIHDREFPSFLYEHVGHISLLGFLIKNASNSGLLKSNGRA